MKETRQTRGSRERKAHLSAGSERLVATARGMASSGSRVEDRFWDAELSGQLQKLLESNQSEVLYDALDRLHQTDLEAYGALIEAVEENAEAVVLEVDGRRWQVLLVVAPVVAWTRFNIPAGPVAATLRDEMAALFAEHVLMPGARFHLNPAVYSIDQLPRDYAQLRKLTGELGAQAISARREKALGKFAESAMMLADARFFVGAVAVPEGSPVFRWQDSAAGGRAAFVDDWVDNARLLVEQVLPGCGFECLLPDAYHLNLREADRCIRPLGVKAAVHFLTHALAIDASRLHATIAAFGSERVDEYRIGLAVDSDGEDIVHGVVWPLLGPESDEDDPPPLARIREQLEEAGVRQIHVWPVMTEPAFCDDCGAPLYPNTRSELMHAELPADVAPESLHFH